jgi:hypothetical protein
MTVPETLPPFDLYAELGVAPSADRATIEAAFRRLMKKHHPDVAGERDARGERGKRLNVARYWLVDPDRRARYDRQRLSPARDSSPDAFARGRPAAPTTPGPSTRRPASAPTTSGPPFGAVFLVGFMLVTGSLLGASSAISAPMTLVALPIGLLMLVLGGLGMALSVIRPPR